EDAVRPDGVAGRARPGEAARLRDRPPHRAPHPPGAAPPRGRREHRRDEDRGGAADGPRHVRRDRGRHGAALRRPDADGARPERPAPARLDARRALDEEHPARAPDARAARLPARARGARREPGRDGGRRVRRRDGRHDRPGGALRPRRGRSRARQHQLGRPRRPLRAAEPLLAGAEGARRHARRPRRRALRRARRRAPPPHSGAPAVNLNDRIARGRDDGAVASLGLLGGRLDDSFGGAAAVAEAPPVVDPHAELKTRVHRACIAKLGTALYTIGSNQELTKLVRDAVAEELALDRTPLSRVARVRVEQEIADDILGYGPLEPFLRDETVTEIMVNGARDVYIERDGKIQPANVTFTDDAHVLRIIDRIV